MRNRFILPLLLVAACAAATPPSSTISGTVGDEARASVPEAPVVLGPTVVCETALRGSIDLAALARLRDATVPEPSEVLVALLRELIDAPPNVVRERRLLAHLGLANEGVAAFEVCAPDETLAARIDALAALAPTDETEARPDLEQAVNRVLAEDPPAYVVMRAWLPTDAPERLEARIADSLARGVSETSGASAGRDRLFVDASHGTALTLTRSVGGVVLEALIAAEANAEEIPIDNATPRALAALRNLGRPDLGGTPLPIDGAAVAIDARPAPLAALNFLAGMTMVVRAVAHADPSAHGELVALGAAEARASLTLAGGSEGADFDRIGLRLADDGTLALRFDARREAALPPTTSTRRALFTGEASSVLAVSPAWLRAYPLPAPSDMGLRDLIERAGGIARLYALPASLGASLQRVMRREMVGDGEDGADQRFEDLGLVLDDDGHTTRIGLVAEGQDPRAAACSFYPDPRPCLERLRVGRPLVPDGEHAVLLASREGRALVVVAHDPTAARRTMARLSIVETPSPIRFQIGDAGLRTSDILQLSPALCGGLSGTLTREGTSITVHTTRLACTAH